MLMNKIRNIFYWKCAWEDCTPQYAVHINYTAVKYLKLFKEIFQQYIKRDDSK